MPQDLVITPVYNPYGSCNFLSSRDRFRLGRTTSGQLPALDLLFESIRTLLTREDFIEISDDTTYAGGPPLCAQIIGAISTLISPQRLRQILEVDATVRPQERGQCMVEKYPENPEENMEMLVFETKEGEVLARVSMEAVCGSSRYFHGMFASDLFEKCSGRRRFLFCPEEEDCSAEDFTRFLHYLAGCRSQCTAISSAHTCVALIRLSDRYLCPSLSEFVCSPHGPVRRILTGETLPVFLPVVLLTQTHERSAGSDVSANVDTILHQFAGRGSTSLHLPVSPARRHLYRADEGSHIIMTISRVLFTGYEWVSFP
ncbi:hypothetical protein TELCIR_15804 [Teladorsagia circumcincta]|uniref:BTB domain-containing protein n=1 Tax=Teladorsagia circumcincta TaxID=45464 RepID=A0A2G9TXG6_TELCI|nr:hypothetical protein TELCIR_15804 [Teladorsagia circumcincta]